jgi:sporulation protein YlmC with PRC-barrel domain
LSNLKVKTSDGKQIGELEIDIGNFAYEKFKIQKLKLKQSKGSEITFNPEETYVKVGLKGTKTDGKARKQASTER